MSENACKGCGVTGVKLWRDYGTPFHWDLWCVDCACKEGDGKIDPATVREDGTRVSETHYFSAITRLGLVTFKGEVHEMWHEPNRVEKREITTDQLGWYVPAIEIGDEPGSFWGYTSWTEERAGDWTAWAELPLRRAAAVEE